MASPFASMTAAMRAGMLCARSVKISRGTSGHLSRKASATACVACLIDECMHAWLEVFDRIEMRRERREVEDIDSLTMQPHLHFSTLELMRILMVKPPLHGRAPEDLSDSNRLLSR